MLEKKKKQKFINIIKKIKKQKFIDIEDLIEIEIDLGYTPKRIIRELRRNAVKKYKFRPSGIIVNSYVGRDKEYLLFPEVLYCSCLSHYPSNVIRRRICHHLICYFLAEILGLVEKYDVEDEFFEIIMDEIR